MRKINILIVEDEIIVAKDIAYYLEELGCNIAGILMTGEEVLPFLKGETIDIILMDIELRGKLNGVEVVHLLKEQYDIPIVFLTANTDDHSFKLAKATTPFAFVEKPFKPKRLVRTIALLIEQIAANSKEKNEGERENFILSDRIFVREKGKMIKLFLADIGYVEADGAYSKIVANNKDFLLATNLRNLESKIASDVLMRVHRSYIINLQKIDSIEDNYVKIGRKAIPVSRSYWNDFLERVNIV